MFLDLQTKASIRRHLGVPASGRVDANTTMGLRTVTKAGQLEYYMNNLQVEEVAILLGRPYGAFVIYAPVVNGNVYSFTLTPTGGGTTTVTYTATSGDAAAIDPLQAVANGLTTAIQAALPAYNIQSGVISVMMQPGGGNIPFSMAIQFSILPTNSTTFTLVGTSRVVAIATGTSLPSPTYVVDDGNGNPANAVIAYGLLPVCDALEGQLLNTGQNLSFSEVGSPATGQAVFRPDELVVRNNLLRRYRYEMGVMLSYFQPNSQTGLPSSGIRV